VVDRDGLENRCACKRTVGSNPTLSAILFHETFVLLVFYLTDSFLSIILPIFARSVER
jgi:hypothetical protein